MRYYGYAGVDSVTFAHQTPTFDWCVVRWGSKNRHHKDACLKEIGIHFQISLTTPHAVVNMIGRTHVFNQGINNHAFPITITKSGEVQFSVCCCRYFVIDMLVLHKFGAVRLINRRWRRRKMNWTTQGYVMLKCHETSVSSVYPYNVAIIWH